MPRGEGGAGVGGRGAGTGGGGGEADEIEAEDGEPGVGDWDNFPLGDNRGDDGDVAESVHDKAAGRGAGVSSGLRGDGTRRMHCSGKISGFCVVKFESLRVWWGG